MKIFNLKNGGKNNCFTIGLVASPEPPFSFTFIKRQYEQPKKIIYTTHR